MLFIRRYGSSGPLVFVLHGGPGAPGHLASVAHALADSYQIVEPFQRSSGDVPLTVERHVEDLYELINVYTPDSPPALLGSSWGAMLALAFAAAHPNSTGPLILVGCGTFDLGARALLQETIGQRMNDRIRERLEQASQLAQEDERLKAYADAMMPIYSFNPLPSLPGEEKVDARAQQETWADLVRLQAEGFYPAAFASIKVPALMVHGDFDPHPGRLIRASLQPYIPHLEYLELERCGHYPWQEKDAAEKFFSLIREWLAERNRHRAV
jgi:pimeloyl-ACP methyl ester carboxylesterase